MENLGQIRINKKTGGYMNALYDAVKKHQGVYHNSALEDERTTGVKVRR